MIDHDIFINSVKFRPAFQVGIFPQLVFHPGYVDVTQQVEIVFALDDLVEDPLVAIAENELAPDLNNIQIGVDEEG